jgi:hypothetical protein
MKFNMDRQFIYITVCINENHQQLQSYYKLTEDYLEEITKECLVDFLVPTDPADMFNVDSPETTPDTARPRKIKKTEEVNDLDNASIKTASISVEQGGDGPKVEQKKGEVTLLRDEEDPSKKRKVYPRKPSSRKKMKETRTKFETTLTSDPSVKLYLYT